MDTRDSAVDGPSYLSIRQAEILFREMGHACHDLLCHAPFAVFSAFPMAWDIVEVPSPLLENFFLERAVSDLFAPNEC
jgi:Zn-dependent oligopeptidase